MIITEKVSPIHPDNIADLIADELVDYCYSKEEKPKYAFEVLISHQVCYIISEASVNIPKSFVEYTVVIISKTVMAKVEYVEVPQDSRLASNQIAIIYYFYILYIRRKLNTNFFHLE